MNSFVKLVKSPNANSAIEKRNCLLRKSASFSAGLIAAFYLLLSLGLVGCLVTRQEVRNSVKSESLTPEQERRTENTVRYQEIEEQIRDTTGRLETLENTVHILNAEKTGTGVDLRNERKSTQEKFKIFEEAITRLEAQNLLLQKRVDELQAAQAGSNSSAVGGSAGSSAVGKSTYDVAELNFTKKKWKEAIVAFEKYRSTNPTGKRYAEATYKIGSSFHELGMKTEAKVFYTEVIEKFGKTEWAKKSQKNLRVLK